MTPLSVSSFWQPWLLCTDLWFRGALFHVSSAGGTDHLQTYHCIPFFLLLTWRWMSHKSCPSEPTVFMLGILEQWRPLFFGMGTPWIREQNYRSTRKPAWKWKWEGSDCALSHGAWPDQTVPAAWLALEITFWWNGKFTKVNGRSKVEFNFCFEMTSMDFRLWWRVANTWTQNLGTQLTIPRVSQSRLITSVTIWTH